MNEKNVVFNIVKYPQITVNILEMKTHGTVFLYALLPTFVKIGW